MGSIIFLAAAVSLASVSGSGMRVKNAVKDAKDNASVHQGKPAEANDEGEHIFATQCSRCHAAPLELPPSGAKTIVRHMRVRANLTAEQERVLLQYIAP